MLSSENSAQFCKCWVRSGTKAGILWGKSLEKKHPENPNEKIKKIMQTSDAQAEHVRHYLVIQWNISQAHKHAANKEATSDPHDAMAPKRSPQILHIILKKLQNEYLLFTLVVIFGRKIGFSDTAENEPRQVRCIRFELASLDSESFLPLAGADSAKVVLLGWDKNAGSLR